MKTKKSTKSAKTTLTLKRAKLLKEIPTAASVAEAGEKAGYHDRQTAHRTLKGIAERTPEVLERLGLTIEYVADKCLRPLLEAKETKFFANQGIVLDTREVEALDREALWPRRRWGQHGRLGQHQTGSSRACLERLQRPCHGYHAPF